MKSLTQVVLVIALTIITTNVIAQVELSGEIRPRMEVLHGYKSLANESQEAAVWVEQRSRLNFNYTGPKFLVGVVLQDIRVWGSTPQLNKVDGFTSIHEAWGAVLFNKHFSMKLGRQELIYDDHRIFGNVGWAQQARSHDVARLQYQDSTTTVHLGFAFNQDATQLSTTVYTMTGNYKTIQYLWFHKDVKDALGVSILVLNNGLQYSEVDSGETKYSVKFSQTVGTHLTYKKKKFSALGNFYYQSGKDGADKTLKAYTARAEFYYKVVKSLTLGAGYEILSGTSQTDVANTDNNSFSPFYGTNHKFNGFMDYFYVGNHMNTVGLQDAYFRVKHQHKKFTTMADVHAFMAGADVLDVAKFNSTGEYVAMDPLLGIEIDLTAKYAFTEGVTIQAGYSHLFGTETMETIKGGDKGAVSNWAYAMVTFKPVFFKSK